MLPILSDCINGKEIRTSVELVHYGPIINEKSFSFDLVFLNTKRFKVRGRITLTILVLEYELSGVLLSITSIITQEYIKP